MSYNPITLENPYNKEKTFTVLFALREGHHAS